MVKRHTRREANTERLSGLYDEYADAIYRYCFFRIFSKQRAEEMMQESFLRLWRYMEEGKDIAQPKSLLYTIATHLVIDEKRKAREESLDATLEAHENLEPSDPGAENAALAKAMMREVREELAKLSPDEQELFTLRFVNDLDPKEIASMRGTGANVISVQLNRILHKLRANLM